MIAIIEDKSVDDRHGTAEYKCPYSACELLPIEACAQVKSLFCETKDGKLKLKQNHNYYDQIQGILT